MKKDAVKLKRTHPWRMNVPLNPKTLPPKTPNWSDRILKR